MPVVMEVVGKRSSNYNIPYAQQPVSCSLLSGMFSISKDRRAYDIAVSQVIKIKQLSGFPKWA